MIYREFNNKKISALGLGAMRLPIKNNQLNNIDEETVAEMV